jgi:hypothetical protein
MNVGPEVIRTGFVPFAFITQRCESPKGTPWAKAIDDPSGDQTGA